ncbi:4-carboxymuconolactone decarboxylase [Aeromicrobium sp. PE09-221]|uniref:carboxymuconolactone decarboxylase family protein n=1 Tax=Aeromicrobium sp. PE09-221 TaxID=1898043 RepID=UPI000B3ECFE9|nr:carboxymuconolactone decarboxylase family protein [Aeromicrobium sp. PE09-221]OUZ07165.1 4-carboxymuconolactone decarboxylase [Aeromicrobium sp. PE09-221]
MTPRVAPGGWRELGPVNWLICCAMARAAGVPEARVFTTLGRARGTFRGWLHYSATLMPFGRLTRYETELAILRVAHVRGCEYERDHHLRLGARAGVTAELAERVFTAPDSQAWPPRHRALLAAVDRLVEQGDLDDDQWSELAAHFSGRELIEIVLLVGHYNALATALTTLRVERDLT